MLHAKALVRAVEQDPTFFVSIAHYAERLNWILGNGVGELTQDELRVVAERIEDFFAKWRPTGDGLYIPPRQAENADPIVQEINRIVRNLVTLDEAEFQALVQSELRSAVMANVADGSGAPARDPVQIVEHICNRFHLVARQLRCRHGDRDTLAIEDEYDVQDLLHALLTMEFDDIRSEEWTPSYAGSGARVDFLLKQERIVIEAKKTRKGLGAKEVGEQLMIDIQRYQVHPDCRTLVCFVYDPEGRIGNPRGLENDLNGQHNDLEVRVMIVPKGL